VSRVSGASTAAPGLTHHYCSGGESLATCGRFDRLGIGTNIFRTRSKRLTTCALWPV